MLLSKIKKHFSILLIRLNQKRELQKIYKENNSYLNLVVESFLEIKLSEQKKEHLHVFKSCEAYRHNLLRDNRLISYEIFDLVKTNKVKDICRQATSSPIWGQFLYLIIKKISNPVVLEIGTNLGVSGSYILSALNDKKDSLFITMEGIPDLCKIAHTQFSSIAPEKKFKIIQGLYEDTFSTVIDQKINFNIVFVDGNHRKKDTLYYFNTLISIIDVPCIMIFDDINWSVEMNECWSIIQEDPVVSYSIDYYRWGIIIIDQSKSSQNKHFKLHLDY